MADEKDSAGTLVPAEKDGVDSPKDTVTVPAGQPAAKVQETTNADPKAPVAGDSPAPGSEAEKRLKDTQAWGHQQAEENARLRGQLKQIFDNPLLNRVINAAQTGVAPKNDTENDIARAWKEYREAPDDETAFKKLIDFASERGKNEALETFNEILVNRENATRTQQQQVEAATTINRAVTEAAPDVPLELFWAMSQRAESETPENITDPATRIAWQVDRSVALARAVLKPSVDKVIAAADQDTAVNRGAAAIMSGGGNAPGAGGSGGGAVGRVSVGS